METSRIIVAIIILSVMVVASYYAYKLGVKNYQEYMPIFCGVFMIVSVLRIMSFIIHFINGFMGWKSILFN